MRYKRKNTLALDVSAVPIGHRLAVVQPLLTFLKLDPAKLTSVQFHSSRKTIFIGLPDDRSAAATAAKTPRFSITLEGAKIYVPLEFVDEDVVDVRVCDLPPETPATVIHQALRQYGEVFSVTSEVWRDFFPGVPTGVKIARMKIVQTIPARISIGNSRAVICYDGQPRRNNGPSNTDGKTENKKVPLAQKQLGENTPADNKQQQKEQQQHQQPKPAAPKPAAAATRTAVPMQTEEAASSDFTTVNRKRGKQQQQHQQQQKKQQTETPSIPPLSDKDQRTLEIWKNCFLALGIPMLDDAQNKNNSNKLD